MVILFPRRRKKLVKKRKSESAKADPKDCENTYGIDCLKIGEATHDSYDPKWIFAERRISQMTNRINNNKSLTHECNLLFNLLNPLKREK